MLPPLFAAFSQKRPQCCGVSSTAGCDNGQSRCSLSAKQFGAELRSHLQRAVFCPFPPAGLSGKTAALLLFPSTPVSCPVYYRPVGAKKSRVSRKFQKAGGFPVFTSPPRGQRRVFHPGNRSDHPQTVCVQPWRRKIFARPFLKGRSPAGNRPFSTRETEATTHKPYPYHRGGVKFSQGLF